MNKSKDLYSLKQSVWFDNVDRKLIMDGWLKGQIEENIIFGLTSNPSIFKNSISSGNAYSLDIQSMSLAGLDTKQIYEKLAIDDIQNVADLLHSVYLDTNRVDGYVSLEVDPELAYDTHQTVDEARRLWKLVDRKNLMIKIPATRAGISAIRETIAYGINVNVTLIFSVERYLEVIEAYFSGLEDRIENKLPIDGIHSVASFFVSRLDVKIETKISELIRSGKISEKEYQPYMGKPAINNALYAYRKFKESIQSERFKNITEKKGNVQRPLWASTGTKNISYSDVLYVEKLILPQTVNTIPPKTLTAFLDHGKSKIVDFSNAENKCNLLVNDLKKLGLNFSEIWSELEQEGVAAFSKAQGELKSAIEKKRISTIGLLGELQLNVEKRIKKIKSEKFSSKLFLPDATIWTSDESEAEEIVRRMGWVDAPVKSRDIVPAAEKLLEEIKSEGFTHAVVLGMGGSSLAPEVFSKVNNKKSGISLSILDSTNPDQIQEKVNEILIEKTLFILSSKSGTTAEMRTLFSYFWEQVSEIEREPGNHFIAITDPETQLEKLGKSKKFRKVFNSDPNVGGRYSALIAFGIIPAVLAGLDGYALLNAANQMREKCAEATAVEINPGFILGSVLSEANLKGKDKLIILTDKSYEAFGSWLEQLVAESSGKTGKGIVPIDLEPKLPIERYSDDRIFYYLRSEGSLDEAVNNLAENNHPVIISPIETVYGLGSEIYKWEVAAATACSILGVNPFNQPNVQESKSITNEMIYAYKDNPVLEEGDVLFSNDSYAIFANGNENLKGKPLEEILSTIISPKKGDYIGINAFLPRNNINFEALQQLRRKIMQKYSIPVTLGFGPRFLHSTGQLHKGGKNNGIFLILTQDPSIDIPIPNEGMKFSTLERAQALGDKLALEQNGRRVLRMHFNTQTFLESDTSSFF
jgi:transaldolase / glucose-6-phosphate isomerase